MSFASPTLTGQFDSVCPRRLQRLVTVNTANKQDDVIIDFCLIVFILGAAVGAGDRHLYGRLCCGSTGERRNRSGRRVDVFSFQTKRKELEQKLTVALSWCLDFSGVIFSAREMETKLNQGQTEEICEKN